MHFHTLSVDSVFKELDSSAQGLTSQQANQRLAKYGPNKLKEEKRITALQIFLSQFKSALVIILIAAAAISFAIGELIDAAVIGIIVILNAIFGFVQEYKAEKAMEALKRMAAPHARVLRNGKETKIDAEELAPGDIILLEAGDRVPADARLVQEFSLQINESTLTGESAPVEKNLNPAPANAQISNQKCMVFASTIVTLGRCIAIVTSTGTSTEIGKISEVVRTAREEKTPLQKKLATTAKFLGLAVIAICAIIFGVGAMQGIPLLQMFLTSVSLAVAAVPEGLPAVVTITLAVGLKIMAARKAIVRKLPVAETLGSASIICSDKTGTLTKNEMTVKQIYTNCQIAEITGEGYSTEGDFKQKGKSIRIDEHVKLLLELGAVCNSASLQKKDVLGDPTEVALLVAAAKASLDHETLKKKYVQVGEVPFDSERKRMSTIHKHPNYKNQYVVAVKGALETLLERCSHVFEDGKVKKLTKADKERIAKINDRMASNALRVLGVAYKLIPSSMKKFDKSLECDLIFVGLTGMIDPPRPEVKSAVQLCKKAGIKVVMITGDNKLTAAAIGQEIGLFDSKKNLMLTGEELDKLSDRDFKTCVEDVTIYARVSPEHKTRIIDTLKSKGHIVAMTGDGVNDAPALKKADIGVAMGLKGTDVAKEASDIVLEDDNFATIIGAVEQGRSIYDNIKKFVRYLLSCNLGEVLTIFVAFMVTQSLWGVLVLPLITAQILWMNLLTDGLPALALGVDEASSDVMSRPPRSPREYIINKNMVVNVVLVGLVMALGTLFVFNYGLALGAIKAQTLAFTTIVMFQLFNVFNSRSESQSVFRSRMPNKWLLLALTSSLILQLAVVYVPILQGFFGTMGLTLAELVLCVWVASSVIFAVEVQKVLFRTKS